MHWTRRIVTALAAAALAGPAAAQDLARGQELFQLCSACHGTAAEGNASIQAPAIAGLPAAYVSAQLHKFQSGVRGGNPDDHTGLRMRPMSRTLRSDEDTESVAAYVASLPPTDPAPTLSGGDASRGAALYAPCTACHGARAEGNPALNAPPLSVTNDWYQLAQIQKFKAGIRGGNPADATGALMRPMALTLANDQAVMDVIAYITTLSQ